MSLVVLDTVLANVVGEGIELWTRDGGLITTSWAIGKTQSVFGQPVTVEALSLTEAERLGVHALMGSAVDAQYFGRIDEVYVAERSVDDPTPEAGDIQDVADIDPTVQTALVCEGLDVETGLARAMVAVFTLSDDGQPLWVASWHDRVEGDGEVPDQVRAAANVARQMKERITTDGLQRLMNGLEWSVTINEVEWETQ